jgi:hypothetical protein
MAANDEKPTDRIRVKHAGTGHHSTIARRTFNPEAHALLKSPAVDKSGRDVPPKFHVSKGGSPAAAEPPTGDADAETRNEETQK